jgi:ribosomal protein S18 acetylase RimI-like enzyme
LRAGGIRVAGPGDLEAIAGLVEEIERYYGATAIQPFDQRVAQIDQTLFGSPPLANVLLAEDGAEIVGLAAYSFLWPAAGTTHSLYLKELYVRADGRRTGTGSRLLAEVLSIAKARPGCSRVEWTADRDNAVAIAFYQALGHQKLDGKIVYRASTCG